MSTGEGKRAAFRARNLAVALSAIAHVAVVFLWLWDTRPSQLIPGSPTMNVELVRDWPAEPRAARAERSRVATSEAGPRATKPGDARSRLPTPRPLDIPRNAEPGDRADAGPPAVRPDEDAAAVRTLLRGVLGCGHQALLHMSPSEREACDERLAAARQTDRDRRFSQLNLDKRGAFAASKVHEPLLARTPKNGCEPRVKENQIGALGVVRDEWVASVGCALSF